MVLARGPFRRVGFRSTPGALREEVFLLETGVDLRRPYAPPAVSRTTTRRTARGIRRAAVEPTVRTSLKRPPPVPNARFRRSKPRDSRNSSISILAAGISAPKTISAATIPTELTTPNSRMGPIGLTRFERKPMTVVAVTQTRAAPTPPSAIVIEPRTVRRSRPLHAAHGSLRSPFAGPRPAASRVVPDGA